MRIPWVWNCESCYVGGVEGRKRYATSEAKSHSKANPHHLVRVEACYAEYFQGGKPWTGAAEIAEMTR